MTLELHRFRHAQDSRVDGFELALAELRAGRKRSHWIWYVFPQLRGLGQSPTAVAFGLDGVTEARAYLSDPVLRERLLLSVEAVHTAMLGGAVPADTLLGSRLDALKLVSSLTLFESVAHRLGTASGDPALVRLAALTSEVLDAAAEQGLPRCAFTRSRLAG